MTKKLVLIIGILTLSLQFTFGQLYSDTIRVEKRFGGPVYERLGTLLKPRDLLHLTQNNPEAYQEMKIAKTNYDVGTVLGTVGGFLIGYPLGTAIGGGEPVWEMAAVGAGLAIISIPFSVGYSKHSQEAVRIYNRDKQATSQRRASLKFGLTHSGIGLKYRF